MYWRTNKLKEKLENGEIINAEDFLGSSHHEEPNDNQTSSMYITEPFNIRFNKDSQKLRAQSKLENIVKDVPQLYASDRGFIIQSSKSIRPATGKPRKSNYSHKPSPVRKFLPLSVQVSKSSKKAINIPKHLDEIQKKDRSMIMVSSLNRDFENKIRPRTQAKNLRKDTFKRSSFKRDFVKSIHLCDDQVSIKQS